LGTRISKTVGFRPKEYDHIVVGAGALGTSTAYQLGGYPGRTLVPERFHENHPFGSSHGRTRILRTAYAEGAAYVPLVLRARELWIRLGRDVGEEIFRPTGVLLAGSVGSVPLAGARANARRFGLPHETLDPPMARKRFPAFHFSEGDEVLWDPRGGVLFPERAIRAYRRLAHRRGVRFRWNSPVARWKERSGGRITVTAGPREYLGHSLVLSAGAWMSELTPELRLPLSVEQQTVYWFRPRPRRSAPLRGIPAFVWYDPRGGYYYGTPDLGGQVKIGGCDGQPVRDLDRRPPSSARELRSIVQFSRERLPGLSTDPDRHLRCLYTNTPDKNFIVDFHPGSRNVVVVSACSGHGFKFASVMGKLIAEGVVTGRLSPLLARFGLPSRGNPGRRRAG
jgi:sarcosine oxidase